MTAEDRPQIAATEKPMGRGRRIPIGRRFESAQERGHWSKGALCERVTQPRVARTHALVPRTL
ncbi:hypothetical protein CN140_35800 [Sinorhizobium meliloti]|nr:hypothetical protein CN140_35800 [Sinorhizobium meliloti]